jgi:hypothetical protein
MFLFQMKKKKRSPTMSVLKVFCLFFEVVHTFCAVASVMSVAATKWTTTSVDTEGQI